MKKIFGAILLCALALPLAAFDIPPGYGKGFYEPLLDLFATGVNSGLAAVTIPPRIARVGIQANFAMNKNDGVLNQVGNKDNYFFPILFANLHLKNFIIFARGFGMAQHGLNTWYAGGGLGYIVFKQKLIIPQIRVLAGYHMLNSGNADFKVSSATVNAVADLKIPVLPVHILANIGYERNMLDASAANVKFGVNRIRASLGAQATLFWIMSLSYEYTIIPNPNHNIGISLGF
jgi:hypothetical protein